MPFANLIAFDRPVADVVLRGPSVRYYSEKEISDREEAAYRRGVDDTRALADQQLVEFRADVERLSDGVLKNVSNVEAMLIVQLRQSLPDLALDIARRLLAGYEPSPEITSRLCEEALIALFPERENLELSVSARDAETLEKTSPEWMKRYPGLRVIIDATLSPGDCQVRSRFGLTDARQKTKLAALAHAFSPAS